MNGWVCSYNHVVRVLFHISTEYIFPVYCEKVNLFLTDVLILGDMDFYLFLSFHFLCIHLEEKRTLLFIY